MTESREPDGTRRRALSPVLGLDDFSPLSSTVRVEFGAYSCRGHVRSQNEDHYLIVRLDRSQEIVGTSLADADVLQQFNESGFAMVVADGLGGTGRGAAASRIALSTLVHLAVHYGQWNVRVDGRTATEIIERQEWFYRRINDAVAERASRDPALAGMATTLTAVYSAGDDLFVAHVGHSRAYLFRDGNLTQLTSDHTVEQRMSAAPPGPAEVQGTSEDLRHILTETIGGGLGGPSAQVAHFRLWDGDIVLLCTDGLTSVVSDDQIANILALRRRLEDQCRDLTDLALQNGGQDNVTVVMAQYRVPRPS